jgi:glutamate-ammonia-ligase adenylyltransferase
VAGDALLHADFERVRDATLASARDPEQVREDVVAMRRRMRVELDRSDAAMFDLKQGEGGLVDLEFLLQALVLMHAHAHRELLGPRNTPGLIATLRECALLGPVAADAVQAAHATLLVRGLDCTLDRRQRRVAPDAEVDTARTDIRRVAQTLGLDFAGAQSP